VPEKKAPAGSNGHGGGSNGQRKETPEDRAQRTFEAAKSKWMETFEDRVRDELREVPGRLATFAALVSTKLYRDISLPWYRPAPAVAKKAEAAAGTATAKALFKVLTKPTLEGLREIEEEIDPRQMDLQDHLGELTPAALALLGDALGIQTGDRPKLEDFVAAEKQAKPAGKGKAPAKGKPAAADEEGGEDDA
jgi:hypothetical protein